MAWAASGFSTQTGVVVRQNDITITFIEDLLVELYPDQRRLNYVFIDAAVFVQVLAIEYDIVVYLEDTPYASAAVLSSAILNSLQQSVLSSENLLTTKFRAGAGLLKAVPLYDVSINKTIGGGSTPSASTILTTSVLASYRNRDIDADMLTLYNCLRTRAAARAARAAGGIDTAFNSCGKTNIGEDLVYERSLGYYEALPDIAQVYNSFISNKGEHQAACDEFESFLDHGLPGAFGEVHQDMYIAVQYAYQDIDPRTDWSYTTYHETICDDPAVVYELLEAARARRSVHIECENPNNRHWSNHQNKIAVWSTYKHTNSLSGTSSFCICVNCIGIEMKNFIKSPSEVIFGPCSRGSVTDNAFFVFLKMGYKIVRDAPDILNVKVLRGRNFLRASITLSEPGTSRCLATPLNNTFFESTDFGPRYEYDVNIDGILSKFIPSVVSLSDIISLGSKAASSVGDNEVSIVLANLRPSTKYAVMCVAISNLGFPNTYDSVLQHTIVTETLCCPELIFPSSYNEITQGIVKRKIISVYSGSISSTNEVVFQYRVDTSIPPKTTGIEVSLKSTTVACATGLPLSIASVSIHPSVKEFDLANLVDSISTSGLTIGSNQAGFLESSFVVRASGAACVQITGTVRYVQGTTYVSSNYISSYLPVQIVDVSTFIPPLVLLSSAYFNNAGTRIFVQLSANSDRGSSLLAPFSSKPFGCFKLFTFSNDMHLDGRSSCQFVSPQLIRIALFTTSISYMSISSNIVLLSGKLKAQCLDKTGSACNSYQYTTYSTVSVGFPSNPVVPVVKIRGPDVISACAEFKLDLTESSGKGSAPWKSIVWRVSSLKGSSTSSIQAYLTLYHNTALDFAHVPRNLFGNDTYMFQVEVINMFDLRSVSAKKVTFVGNNAVPVVNLLGPASVRRHDVLRVRATAHTVSCNEQNVLQSRGGLTLAWNVYEDGIYTEKFPSVNSNPYVYEIAKYKLSVGSTYRFRLTVTNTLSSETMRSAVDDFSVTVQYGSISAKLNSGESLITLYENSLFEINASKSYLLDSDQTSATEAAISSASLRFVYSCTVMSGTLYGNPCRTKTGNNVFPAPSMSGQGQNYASLVFDASMLLLSTLYKLQVDIYPTSNVITGKYGLNDPVTKIMRIFIQPGLPIPIITLQATDITVNYDEPFLLRSFVQTEHLSSIASWKILDDQNELLTITSGSTPSNKQLSRGTTTFAVFVPAYSLDPDSTYTFVLSATYTAVSPTGAVGIAVATSEVNIAFNGPPFGGGVVVDPTVGIALQDRFTLTAYDWSDDPEDYPLEYRFWLYVASPKDRVLIRDFELSRFTQTLLGGGNVKSGYAVIISVDVEDLHGAEVSAETTVVVTSFSNLLAEYTAAQSLVTRANGYYPDIKSILNVLLLAATSVDCTSAPICSTLNRHECSTTPATCGECLDSHPFGAYGHAVSPCYATFEETNFGISRQQGQLYQGRELAELNGKTCPNDCSAHGICTLFSFLGDLVKTCSEISSCSARCVCDSGFYSVDCSLQKSEFDTIVQANAYLMQQNLLLKDTLSDVTESIVADRARFVSSLLHDFSLISASTYTDCLIFVIQTINENPELCVTTDNFPIVLRAVSSLLEKGIMMSDAEYLMILSSIHILNEYRQANMAPGEESVAIYTKNLRYSISVNYFGSLGVGFDVSTAATVLEQRLAATSNSIIVPKVKIVNENAINGSISNTVVYVGVSLMEILVHTGFNSGNSSKVDVLARWYPELFPNSMSESVGEADFAGSSIEYTLVNHERFEYDVFEKPVQSVTCRVSYNEKPYSVPLNCSNELRKVGVPEAPPAVECTGNRAYVYSYVCPYKLSYPVCATFAEENTHAATIADRCSVSYFDGDITVCSCEPHSSTDRALQSIDVELIPSNLVTFIKTDKFMFNFTIFSLPFTLYNEQYMPHIVYSALSVLFAFLILSISIMGLLKLHPLHLFGAHKKSLGDDVDEAPVTPVMATTYYLAYPTYNAQFLLDNNILLTFRNKSLYMCTKVLTSLFPTELNSDLWYMRWWYAINENSVYAVLIGWAYLKQKKLSGNGDDEDESVSQKIHPESVSMHENRVMSGELGWGELPSTERGAKAIFRVMALFTLSATRCQKCLGIFLRVLTIMVTHAIVALMVYPDNYQCENIDSAQNCYSQESRLPIYPYVYPMIRIDGREERSSSYRQEFKGDIEQVNQDYYNDGSMCLWDADTNQCFLRDPMVSYAHVVTVLILGLILAVPVHAYCEWALSVCADSEYFISFFYVDESIYEGSFQDKLKKKIAERDNQIFEEYLLSQQPEVFVAPDNRTAIEKQLDLLYDGTTATPTPVIIRKKPVKTKGGHAYYDQSKVNPMTPAEKTEDLQVAETGGYEKLKKREKLYSCARDYVGPTMSYLKTSRSRASDQFIHKFSFFDYPANVASPKAELEYLRTISKPIVNPSLKKYRSDEIPPSDRSPEHSSDRIGSPPSKKQSNSENIGGTYLQHMLFLTNTGRFKAMDSYTLLRGYWKCQDYLMNRIEESRMWSEHIVRNMDILTLSQHLNSTRPVDISFDVTDESRVIRDVYLCEQFLLNTLPREVHSFAQLVMFDENSNRLKSKMGRQAWEKNSVEFNGQSINVSNLRQLSSPSVAATSAPNSPLRQSGGYSNRFNNSYMLKARYAELKALLVSLYYRYKDLLVVLLLMSYISASVGFLLSFGTILGSVSTKAWVIFVAITICIDVLVYVPVFIGITHVVLYDVMIYHMQVMHRLLMKRYEYTINPEEELANQGIDGGIRTSVKTTFREINRNILGSRGSFDVPDDEGTTSIALIQHFNPACRAARIYASKNGMFQEEGIAEPDGFSRSARKFKTYNNSIRKAMGLNEASIDDLQVPEEHALEKNASLLLCNISEFDLHGENAYYYVDIVMYNNWLTAIYPYFARTALRIMKFYFMLGPQWFAMMLLQWIVVVPTVAIMLLSFYYLYQWQHTLLVPVAAAVCIVVLLVTIELRRGYDKHAVDNVRLREAVCTLMEDIIHRPKDKFGNAQRGENDYVYNTTELAFEATDTFKNRQLMANSSFGRVHTLLFNSAPAKVSYKWSGSPIGSPHSPPTSPGVAGRPHSDQLRDISAKSGKSTSIIYPQPAADSIRADDSELDQPSYIDNKIDFMTPARGGPMSKVTDNPHSFNATLPVFSPEKTDHNTNLNKSIAMMALNGPSVMENDEMNSLTGSLSRHKLPPLGGRLEKDFGRERDRSYVPNDSFVSVFTSSKEKNRKPGVGLQPHQHSSEFVSPQKASRSGSRRHVKNSKKTQMTIEEYQLLSKTIATVFLDEEEANIDENGKPEPAVMSQSFLIASSLHRALGEEDMEDVDPVEYAEKSRILEKVLRRMIHKDGSVIIASNNAESTAGRLLQLNPSSIIRKHLLK